MHIDRYDNGGAVHALCDPRTSVWLRVSRVSCLSWSIFALESARARVQISLVYDTAAGAGAVTELKVKYFDTIPVCTALCILKTGFLFAASEAGDHGFYEFLGLGDDDDGVEASSLSTERTADGFAPVFFDPQLLKNLQLVDSMMSLAPMTDMKVKNLIGAVRPCFPLHPGLQLVRLRPQAMRCLHPG